MGLALSTDAFQSEIAQRVDQMTASGRRRRDGGAGDEQSDDEGCFLPLPPTQQQRNLAVGAAAEGPAASGASGAVVPSGAVGAAVVTAAALCCAAMRVDPSWSAAAGSGHGGKCVPLLTGPVTAAHHRSIALFALLLLLQGPRWGPRAGWSGSRRCGWACAGPWGLTSGAGATLRWAARLAAFGSGWRAMRACTGAGTKVRRERAYCFWNEGKLRVGVEDDKGLHWAGTKVRKGPSCFCKVERGPC